MLYAMVPIFLNKTSQQPSKRYLTEMIPGLGNNLIHLLYKRSFRRCAPDLSFSIRVEALTFVKLRRERDELAKAKKAAEDAALAKSGEIAIVRANQTKTERFFQAQIQELQRRHQGEAANHRLEVERALAEKQKIATEKGFLQNDLAEGNQQIRDLQRAVKAKDTASKAIRQKDDGVATLPTTPKKSKSVKHADGFDQDELQPQLPIRSKNSTPKAGSKRKRKAVAASPVKPLELSKANEALEPADTIQITSDQSFAGSDTAGAAPPAAATFSAIAPPDERFHVRYQQTQALGIMSLIVGS